MPTRSALLALVALGRWEGWFPLGGAPGNTVGTMVGTAVGNALGNCVGNDQSSAKCCWKDNAPLERKLELCSAPENINRTDFRACFEARCGLSVSG